MNGSLIRLRRLAGGFTLIEVVVVMAIVAILAAIAIPNYTEYLQRGHRSDAKTQLQQLAQWQERFRTENNRYAEQAEVPAGLLAVGTSGRYNIVVARPTLQTYTLTAGRAGAQAADLCGDFTLTQLGVRGLVGNTNTFDQCWTR